MTDAVGWRTTALLLLPAASWFLVLLVLPLVVILVYSLGERAPEGGYAPALTLAQYANLPARWAAFQNTLTLAPLGTLATLLAAYPLAYWLALRCPPRWRVFLLVLVIVPFWTSLLIRTYAWIFILGGRGLPALLGWLGLGEPRLINTPFAVLVGIVYGYLPLMVFPIYVSLEKLDRRLLEASADLYATPARTFLQVTLPLSLPGVATGSMLVFILLMGEFLIPALLGGGKVFFIGNALVDLFLQSRNWPFGAAVAVALGLLMLATVTAYMRLVLGRAGAEIMAREGAYVVVADRDSAAGADTVHRIRAAGGHAESVVTDVADDARLEHLVRHVTSHRHRIDILHNHAGVQVEGTLEQVTPEGMDASWRVNVRSHFLLAKLALPHMKRAGKGVILNTSSNSGVFLDNGMLAYITTKTAVIAMTRQMALDYAPFGIRANALCPGWVDTPFNEAYTRQLGGRDNLLRYIREKVPLGRFAAPEEIAEAILFCVSDRSAYMTGHALVVDGGESL